MSLRQHKKADNIKWIITFVLIAILAIGCTIMAVKIVKNETTDSVDSFGFEIGGFDVNGKAVNDTSCIRTKNSVTVDGLTIEIADEANVKYKVYYYTVDEDTGKETFVSASADWLTADLVASTIPSTAEVCRVVVQPTMDAEVSFFEINGYAQQLVITYNK